MSKLIPKIKIVINNMFTKHLLITNVTLGSVFMGTGDAIQQLIERKVSKEPKPHDFNRTGKMFLGGICFGLIGHGWYKFLDTRFPGTQSKTILKKLFAEVLAGPPLVFSLFLAFGVMENKPIKQTVTEFKGNLLYLIVADWGFYVPLQSLNFYYLPPKYRYLYVSTITIFYDVFLSYILHKESIDKRTDIKTKSIE